MISESPQLSAVEFEDFIADPANWPATPVAELVALVAAIARACRRVGEAASLGRLLRFDSEVVINVQGEAQKPLDVVANDIFIEECGPFVGAIISEELEAPLCADPRLGQSPYILAIDPLDGSANTEIAMTFGAFFSVLHAPTRSIQERDLLQAGEAQIVSGYALFGPTTMLVFTLGCGVQGFTLSPGNDAFRLTHPAMTIAPTTNEYAINASNQRFWEPPVKLYIQHCQDGAAGPLGYDFNMRWNGALVAELHRILVRGGVFLYPWDSRVPARKGRLRLLYEANPTAKLVEAAGGVATTGRQRILEIKPTDIHERTPLMFGSRDEVERLEAYHAEYDRGDALVFNTPLFRDRSIFRLD